MDEPVMTTIVDLVTAHQGSLAQTADVLGQIVTAYDHADQDTVEGDQFRTTINDAATACTTLLIVSRVFGETAAQKMPVLLP